MNIFEYYLKEIQYLVLNNKKYLKLEKIDNLKSINLEVPPDQFNFDLSCNIAMVLGKTNKVNPKDLAEKLKKILLEKIAITINVKEKDNFVSNFIEYVLSYISQKPIYVKSDILIVGSNTNLISRITGPSSASAGTG